MLIFFFIFNAEKSKKISKKIIMRYINYITFIQLLINFQIPTTDVCINIKNMY